MDSTRKIEKIIEEWLRPLPHLPIVWRKWLAKNVWWITFVAVIISVIVLFGLFGAISLFSTMPAFYLMVLHSSMIANDGWLWLLSVYVSIALLVLAIVFEAMAISPLKAFKKRGWDLIFLAYLVGVVSGVISAILNLDILGLVSAAISAAISAYFIFEIKSYFKRA
jgi:hypothetical protein